MHRRVIQCWAVTLVSCVLSRDSCRQTNHLSFVKRSPCQRGEEWPASNARFFRGHPVHGHRGHVRWGPSLLLPADVPHHTATQPWKHCNPPRASSFSAGSVLCPFLEDHKEDILCGPVWLASGLDLSGHSGMLSLTSPKLVKGNSSVYDCFFLCSAFISLLFKFLGVLAANKIHRILLWQVTVCGHVVTDAFNCHLFNILCLDF